MNKKLLVIIPCYNEETALPSLIYELTQLDVPAGYELSTVVVNDCSTDNTALIAKQCGVSLLDLPVNLGIGGAVQSGLIYAFENNFDLAVQMDGDGQHPPKELCKLISCYNQSEANVVVGSRFIEHDGFQSSFIRRMGIRYFYRLNRLITGKHIYDSTSGFRLFDSKAIKLAARRYPDEYPEPESLVMFSKAGLTVKETPVVMRERKGGKSSIGNFASLYYCIKVTLAIMFSAARKPA